MSNFYVAEMEKVAGVKSEVADTLATALKPGPRSHAEMIDHHARKAIQAAMEGDLDEADHHIQMAKLYKRAKDLH